MGIGRDVAAPLPDESYSFLGLFPLHESVPAVRAGLVDPSADARCREGAVTGQQHSAEPLQDRRRGVDAGQRRVHAGRGARILTSRARVDFRRDDGDAAGVAPRAASPHLRSRPRAPPRRDGISRSCSRWLPVDRAIEQGTSGSVWPVSSRPGIFGTFGSVAQDMGLIVSFARDLLPPVLAGCRLEWQYDSRARLLLRLNVFDAGDIDLEVTGANGAIYWPASAPWTVSSAHVCGWASASDQGSACH